MSSPSNFASDVYNDDVNSDDQTDDPDNYDVAVDEDRPEDDNDLLFCGQYVGSYKDINGLQISNIKTVSKLWRTNSKLSIVS